MIQSNLFQHEAETPWETVGEGVTRQVFGYDDKLMMVKVKFEQGSIGPIHNHPHSQAAYVESGAFELTMGDTKRIIRKGDGYYVPPFTDHGVICIEAGMLIDAFSPMRWDFVQSDGEQYAL